VSHLGNVPAGVREAAAERRVQAFELRKGGASYRAIGRALGVSEAQAHRDVMGRLSQLAKLEEGAADDVRKLELERIDGIILGHYGRAQNGDDKAARVVLQAMERRAKLLGLDAPVKQELTGKDGAALIALDALRTLLLPEGAS
jgi:hypothetical protein